MKGSAGLTVVGLLFSHVASATPNDPRLTGTTPNDAVPSSPNSPTEVPEPVAPPADPRKAEAEERRQRALRFYDAGNYGAARDEFERANQLSPSFRLLYNLGIVSMALGDSASAFDYFQRYVEDAGSALPPAKQAEIALQLRDLAEHVTTLIVTVDIAGAGIFVDENQVGIAPLARPIHVNSGILHLSARARGRAVSQTLELPGNETVRIELKLVAGTKPAEPPGKPIFWAGWTTTTALAAGASVAGLEAIAAQHAYQQRHDHIGTSRSELDSLGARTTAWSVAADTLAGAAIIVGVYSLYTTLRRAPSQRQAAPVTGNFAMRVTPSQARFSFPF